MKQIRPTEQVNIVFLATVAVYLMASLVASSFGEMGYVPLILISQFSFAAVPFIYAIWRTRNKLQEPILTEGEKVSGVGTFLDDLRIRPLSFGTIVLVVVFTICIMPFLSLLNGLSQCFVKTPTVDMIEEASEGIPFGLMFLLVALLPAVLEEFVYRGVFFRTYEEESVLPGAILSGLLFGVLHGNLNQFIYAFVMGFVFAMVVYVTDSLVASMIMHLTINGLSVCLLYIVPKLLNTLQQTQEGATVSEILEETEDVLTVPLVLRTYLLPAVIGGILAYNVFIALANRSGRMERLREALHQKGKGKAFVKLFSLPLLIGIILMVFLMVVYEIAS